MKEVDTTDYHKHRQFIWLVAIVKLIFNNKASIYLNYLITYTIT